MRRVIPVLVLLAFLSWTLSAQSTNASITGYITDTSRAVVGGVRVIVINTDTNIRSEANTNEIGSYTISNLPPGNYRIEVEKSGFKTVVKSDIVLHVQDSLAINFEIQVGSLSEVVTVEGGAPLINTQNAAVSTVIDRKFVENLPLNGRGFNALLELSPGTVLTRTNNNSQGQFSVNGQRASSNYFSVDGVSANSGITTTFGFNQSGAGTLPSTSVLGGMNALVSAEALQEFRVLTSTFAPEYGRTPGAQISIATRSGTNVFHGSLFEYFRNDKLDANDWFSNQTGLARAALRHNDFGGVFGGPIVRDRTFFFFSYEGLRLLQPQTAVNRSVPSLAARQAAPASLKPYMNAFPLPTGPVLPNGFARLDTSFSTPSKLDATSIRGDHQLGGTAMFVRFAESPSSTAARGGIYTFNTLNSSALRTRSFTAAATSAFSPRITNDARFNWTGTTGSVVLTLDDFGGAQVPSPDFLFPAYTSASESYASINLQGPSTILSIGKFSINRQRQWNIVDTLSARLSRHDVRAGVDARVMLPVSDPGRYGINANFTGVGDPAAASIPAGTFLSGVVSSGSAAIYTSDFRMRYLNWSTFIQDTWRLSSRITTTYGLRWDIVPPPQGLNGLTLFAASGVEPSTITFAPKGTSIWPTRFGNIAPRVGTAITLRQAPNSALVLRFGAGTFFDISSGGFLANQAVTPPHANVQSFVAASFPYNQQTITAPVLPPAPPYNSAFLADPNLETPRTYQWNVSLEQTLGRARSITATYLGAVGSSLARTASLINPNAQFRALSLTRSDASSNYQALQLQFRGQIGNGLSALASYSWAHSIDNISGETVLGTPDISLNRGASDFDVRHALSGGFSFSPAFRKGTWWAPIVSGWGFDGMIRARTSLPIDMFVRRDLGFGTYSFRPDLVPGVPIYIDNPNAGGGRQINDARPPGAPNQRGPFFVSPELRQGNLARNVVRGFGMYQADLAVRREFKLAERSRLQARIELFNATNHPNFGDPSGFVGTLSPTGVFTLNTSNYGLSTLMLGRFMGVGGGGYSPLYQVGGPRSIQLSLKLIF